MAIRQPAPTLESTTASAVPDRGSSFEREVDGVLREIQRGLHDLVARVPGSGQRAVDLQRSLGLDKKLGWQVFRVISATRPSTEVANVPSRWSMERLTTAATKRGVPKAVMIRLMAAFERFEAFAAEHGGDRAGLISLVSGISSDRDQQHELRVRRDLFRGLSHAWGIQAAATVATFVVSRRPGPEQILDSAVIRGAIGIQRLRHGVPLTLRLSTENNPASVQAPGETGGAQGLGAEWIPEFMTEPLPELVPRPSSDGQRLTEVNFPPSGRAGAVTLYTSQRDLDGARGEQANYCLNNAVSTPTELLELELLVPEGLSDPQTVRANVFGRRDDPARAIAQRTIDLLPQRETAIYLGALTRLPFLAGAPHHHEAVEHVIGKLGWLGTRFDVYRCSVAFPLMHTTVGLTVNGMTR